MTAEHWLIQTARTEKLYPSFTLAQTLRSMFIGAVKTLVLMDDMNALRELVSALEVAEQIAKEREP
jgi:hypothetical protein